MGAEEKESNIKMSEISWIAAPEAGLRTASGTKIKAVIFDSCE